VLAQVPLHCVALVWRKRLSQQPAAAFRPEQIGMRARRHEMRVQDRLNDGFQPSALSNDLNPSRDLPRSAWVCASGTQTSGRNPLA
jgi:hypothetical protein